MAVSKGNKYDAADAGEREPLLYQQSAKARIFEGLAGSVGSSLRFFKYCLALWLIPFFLYTGVSYMYMMGWGHCPSMLTCMTVVAAAVCVFFSVRLSLQPPPTVETTIPHSCRKSMYAINAVAIIMGGVIGEGLYTVYMTAYLDYDAMRHYTNVSPDESAAAHADASVLVFAEGTRPDTTKWMGYTLAGTTYCVAPITEVDAEGSTEESTAEIQYWASGKDCCDGTYKCDDVDNVAARSGLVIQRRIGTMELVRGILIDDTLGNYREAGRMAMAKYDLTSSDKAIFVAFVKDITAARNRLYWKAWTVWMYAKLVGAIVFLASTTMILLANYDDIDKDVKATKSEMLKALTSRM